jgi:hypothetical protein
MTAESWKFEHEGWSTATKTTAERPFIHNTSYGRRPFAGSVRAALVLAAGALSTGVLVAANDKHRMIRDCTIWQPHMAGGNAMTAKAISSSVRAATTWVSLLL